MSQRLDRIRRFYTGAAIHLLNILVFFVVINVVAYAIYKIIDGVSGPAENPVVEKYDDLVKEAYPGMSDADRTAMLSETWSRELSFEPFTGFRETPYQGDWVNVHEAGFRQGGAAQPWPVERKSDEFVVFVFGGSTCFGYGVGDSETIPARLQEHLAAKTSRPVQVYNFAAGFYYSTLERIRFERLLIAGHVPDLAVFIDGLNDFAYHQDEPEFSSSIESAMQSGSGAAWARVIGGLPILRLARQLRGGDAGSGSGAVSADAPAYDDPATLNAVISRYSGSRKAVRKVADAFGVGTLFVWQPIPLHRYDQSHHPFSEAGYGVHQYCQKGYAMMDERLASDPAPAGFLDLSGMQEDLKEPLYVDLVHYNAKFSDLIAQRIAAAITIPGMPAAPGAVNQDGE